MKSIVLIVCIIVICTVKLQAQYLGGGFEIEPPKTILRLSLLLPAVVVEGRIAPNTSLNTELSTGFSYTYTVINGRSTVDWGFYPYLTLEPRLYSCLDKRKFKCNGSGNFLGGYLGLPVSIGLTTPTYSIGPVYGIQKELGRNGFWNFEIGLGLDGYKKDLSYGVILNLRLGYILN